MRPLQGILSNALHIASSLQANFQLHLLQQAEELRGARSSLEGHSHFFTERADALVDLIRGEEPLSHLVVHNQGEQSGVSEVKSLLSMEPKQFHTFPHTTAI